MVHCHATQLPSDRIIRGRFYMRLRDGVSLAVRQHNETPHPRNVSEIKRFILFTRACDMWRAWAAKAKKSKGQEGGES